MRNSKLICLFGHYNAGKQVEPYVLTYLQHLESIGFTIFQMHGNKGSDAGLVKWALDNNHIPADTDYVLVTNDSLFGPLFPLASVIGNMIAKTGFDFWGLTENFQGGRHLDSSFLLLSKKLLTADPFKKAFKQDHTKLQQQPLSQILTTAGFTGTTSITYEQLDAGFDGNDAQNTTHYYWDRLITQFHYPFVSKELILQNPDNIQSISEVFAVIEKNSDYPPDNIKQAITTYLSEYDKPTVFPNSISVLCHLFYPGSIYYFLTRLLPLKSPQTQFIFNLSASLYHQPFVSEILQRYFPGSPILSTPNQGRDIGGKMALYDVQLKSGMESDYTLIIHDKLSPHTPTGIEWREKLLKIISEKELPNIFKKFQNQEVGIIGTADMLKTEYDPDKDRFTCTSSDNIYYFIRKFNLQVTDYKFAAGTILWIRTSILRDFFTAHSPLSVRKELEKGNKLDFNSGTNIHAWERLFSFVANSQGFKTIGV